MNQKAFTLILIVLVVALGGYFLYQQQTKSAPITQPSTACSDTKQVADAIENSVSHLGKVEMYQPDDSSPNKRYSWKLTDTEPFRTYNTNNLPYYITFFGQKIEITDQSFKDKTIAKIISLGYVQSQINTKSLQSSDITVNSYARYGFAKGSERVVINIGNDAYQVKNNKQIELPANTSSINISCGASDQTFDDFYDIVIKQSPKLTKNTMLNIWDMKNDVVRMDLSSYPGGFGFEQYWIKKGMDWQMVYEGQDNPKCSVFEKENVGSGFDCYDDQTDKQRVAK